MSELQADEYIRHDQPIVFRPDRGLMIGESRELARPVFTVQFCFGSES